MRHIPRLRGQPRETATDAGEIKGIFLCEYCFGPYASSEIRQDVARPSLPVQGKCDEAEPYYRHARANTERTLGTDHPTYSVDLNNLASLLKEQVRRAGASLCIRFPPLLLT